MTKYKYVVLTNAVDDRDAEFNDWYDNRHLPDVLAVPGFVSAKRYQAAPEMIAAGAAKWKYLAVYDIETDDLNGTMAQLLSRAGTDAMSLSDALDVAGAHAVAYIARDADAPAD